MNLFFEWRLGGGRPPCPDSEDDDDDDDETGDAPASLISHVFTWTLSSHNEMKLERFKVKVAEKRHLALVQTWCVYGGFSSEH